jgi:hypothetical protein
MFQETVLSILISNFPSEQDASKPKALQRDAWMLVPPSSSSALSSLADPTKLKARQFNRSSAAGSARDAPSNLWTETPAERQKRIADEVAGKKRRAVEGVNEAEEADAKVKRRRDEQVRKAIDEHNVRCSPHYPLLCITANVCFPSTPSTPQAQVPRSNPPRHALLHSEILQLKI